MAGRELRKRVGFNEFESRILRFSDQGKRRLVVFDSISRHQRGLSCGPGPDRV